MWVVGFEVSLRFVRVAEQSQSCSFRNRDPVVCWVIGPGVSEYPARSAESWTRIVGSEGGGSGCKVAAESWCYERKYKIPQPSEIVVRPKPRRQQHEVQSNVPPQHWPIYEN